MIHQQSVDQPAGRRFLDLVQHVGGVQQKVRDGASRAVENRLHVAAGGDPRGAGDQIVKVRVVEHKSVRGPPEATLKRQTGRRLATAVLGEQHGRHGRVQLFVQGMFPDEGFGSESGAFGDRSSKRVQESHLLEPIVRWRSDQLLQPLVQVSGSFPSGQGPRNFDPHVGDRINQLFQKRARFGQRDPG